MRLDRGNTAEAQRCFQKALDVARRQQAKLFELRAAVSLGRLWRGQGRGVEARQLVAGVHDWFTEGFSLPDLQDAREFLDSAGHDD